MPREWHVWKPTPARPTSRLNLASGRPMSSLSKASRLAQTPCAFQLQIDRIEDRLP
jgi:hypothetical protein